MAPIRTRPALMLLPALVVRMCGSAASGMPSSLSLPRNRVVVQPRRAVSRLASPLPRAGSRGEAAGMAAERKAALLELVTPLSRGVGNSAEKQKEVVAAAKLLIETTEAPVFPAAANQVEGKWDLLWTTEKETLFLLEKGLPSAPSTGAYQSLSFRGDVPTLVNVVSFENDSELRVDAITEPSAGSPRVNFRFQQAAIKWRGFRVPIPPFGQGWFETVYVDDDLRIAFDIRGDTLICKRAAKASDLGDATTFSTAESLRPIQIQAWTTVAAVATVVVGVALVTRRRSSSCKDATLRTALFVDEYKQLARDTETSRSALTNKDSPGAAPWPLFWRNGF